MMSSRIALQTRRDGQVERGGAVARFVWTMCSRHDDVMGIATRLDIAKHWRELSSGK